MRHDTHWLRELPVVQTSPAGVRMWLPFDCKRNSTGDTLLETSCKASRHSARVSQQCKRFPFHVHERGPTENVDSPANITFSPARVILGTACDAAPNAREFCSTSITPDWWFIADAELADSVGDAIYLNFSLYTADIQSTINLPGSKTVFGSCVPHHYWGFFLRRRRLRENCQLGLVRPPSNLSSHAITS